MKANLATVRANLSKLIKKVEQGEVLEIQKRNVTVAKIIPFNCAQPNMTKLGIGLGTVLIKTDLTDPVMEDSWDMLKGG